MLVARSEDDERRIGVPAAPASLIRADSPLRLRGESNDMRIFCCALGPIHPDPAPTLDTDARRAARDVDLLTRLVMSNGERAMHVIFVSTVLALAPSRDRYYYAGWKRVLEDKLLWLTESQQRTRLSVIYPGRLVGRETTRRLRYVHTTYEALAGLMCSVSTGGPRRAVVGLDARLWRLRDPLTVLHGGSRNAARRLPLALLTKALRENGGCASS